MAATAARRQFKIRGLDCAQEVNALKREVGPLVGGEERLAFDLLKGRMTVAAPPEEVPDREGVVRAVARAGLAAESWEDGRERAAGGWVVGRPLLAAVSGLATLAGWAVHAGAAGWAAAFGSEEIGLRGTVPVAARALYLLAIVAGGWFVLPRAWAALRRGRPDMNVLMTVAVAGALVLGEWLEASLVSCLFAVSLLLESWSVARARRAVEALVHLAPRRARVVGPGGGEEDRPADEVAVGSHFLVRAGERVPLDGRVVRGASEIDQAPITGESLPVPKAPGDEVFAGTINGDGVLVVESTRPAEETTLARLVRMVEEAQERRAPSERWVDRFARVYTPAVMAAALLVLLAPPLLAGGLWGVWFYRALVLLVIACPCALVISTPVSIVAGLASAAHHGVLVKGGLFLELPARLRAIALDKTGTLTRGRAAVVEVVPLADHDEAGLLARAAALEARSSHPLARAIQHARERQVPVRAAEDLQVLPGRGATGLLDGREYWLGSHRYLEQRGQETPTVHERLEAMSDAGHTAVAVGTADHVCGLIAAADPARPEAPAALAALHRLGIRPLVMLTGDNRGTAEGVARETGVDEVQAELLPGEKVAAIEALVARYGQVAMVGDGVNDAPAMARATLSVAMGAAGSDAAIETADIALMADDLGKLPWLVAHSRRTLRVVRQNVAFSLLVKVTFVALALTGTASLWTAIAADMGASLLVIANGLRLLRR